MITVEHLTRRFGAHTAIEDLNFHLDAGEVVGFLGPNGAGKTTTMRILTGYLPASSGSVRIAGLDVLRDSLSVRRQLGYLPESVPLYRELRVREMLTFQARLHGMSSRESRPRIRQVLERVRIAEREESLVGSLSRGQRQRVGLAVALLPRPKVLILDEPTSGLDPLQRLEMRALLRELAREHTVLLSSHILPEIEAVCGRVIILNHGRIAADGTPEQLVRGLGQKSAVRLEAVVKDPAEAARLLAGIRGVGEVRDQGRLGIHHVFDVHCEEDLREDVGALAHQRGWALRELSWKRPTLEELFASIALDLEREHGGPEPSGGPGAAGTSRAPSLPGTARPADSTGGLLVLATQPGPSTAPAPVAPGTPGTPGTPMAQGTPGAERKPLPLGTKTPPRPAYNLNPFEAGAHRDLSKPLDPAAPQAEGPAERGPGGTDCNP